MAENGPEEDVRAVRVELLGGETSALDDIAMPGPVNKGLSKLPALLMVVAIGALFGGLWWLSNLESSTDSAIDDSAVDDSAIDDSAEAEEAPEQVGEQPPVASNDDPDTGTPTQAGEALDLVPLDVIPTYVVPTENGLLAGGALAVAFDAGDPSAPTGPSAIVAMIAQAQWWGTAFGLNVPDRDLRLVGLQDDGTQFVAFAARVVADESSTSELVVYVTNSGEAANDEEWVEQARFPIDGHVRTVSARDGQWAAIVDRRAQSSSSSPPMQTQIVTGRVDGGPTDTTLIEVAPDEFVSSFVAIDGGFFAVVVRLQLNNLSEEGSPPPQLRHWNMDAGWTVLDVAAPVNASVQIIDGGRSGVFLARGAELAKYNESFDVADWPEAARGSAVTGGLDESFSPLTTPSRTGPGFLTVDRSVGPVSTVWLSFGGQLWQRFPIEPPLHHVSLQQISDRGVAILTGVSNGEPVAFSLGLTRSSNGAGATATDTAERTPSFEVEVQRREIVEGEWSTPVFSTSATTGAGFVGLSNINGQISLVESANGFDVDRTTMTDFPFGYFTNKMQTTSAGYHVIGRLGLFEDAVFTSGDGVSWNRFDIGRFDTATAIQIDHFERSENAAVMAGSLGWADDLERTELVMAWWDSEGVRHEVPARPCDERTVSRCSVSSLTAVSDGVVAIHQVGDVTRLSKWTKDRNWQSIVTFEVVPGGAVSDVARLQSYHPDVLRVLGFRQVFGSSDGGQTWTAIQGGPPGLDGGGLSTAISADGLTAVFTSIDGADAWVLYDGLWSRFNLDPWPARPLAIADGIALFSAGSVIIRLAPTGVS